MSLRAISETSIYLDSFRNIDLFQQGYYYFKIVLYYEKDGLVNLRSELQKVISNPYSQFKVHSSRSKALPHNSRLKTYSKLHFLCKSDVDHQENSYKSQIFYIRYTDEHVLPLLQVLQVSLEEVVNFRTEVETKVDFTHEHLPFTIEAKLFFAEASESEIKNPRNIPDYLDEDRLGKLTFKCVSERKFKVNSMLKGVAEFFPLNFHSTYFSSINMLVHSALIDFKFRFQTLGMAVKQGENKSMQSEIKIVPSGVIQKKQGRRVDSLTEFLFSDDKDDDEERIGYLPIEVEKKDIERVYHIFVQSLINGYEKLRKHHNRYLKQAPAKQKLAMAEVPPLQVRHDGPFEKEWARKEPLSELNEDPASNKLRKMNSTSFPKKKSDIDTSASKENKEVIPEKKPLPRDPKHILKGKGAVPGLQFNCLDNICTKSLLDKRTHSSTVFIKECSQTRGKARSPYKFITSTPNEEYQDFNSSQILEESQFLNHKLKSLQIDMNEKVKLKCESQLQKLPFTLDSENSPHANDIYESLPSTLTKTILKNSSNNRAQPIFFHNQRSITPVRSFDKGAISNKLHAYQSGETKSIEEYKKQGKPFMCNLKSKMSSPVSNKEILQKLKREITKQNSQLQTFRSQSQNQRLSMTPTPATYPEDNAMPYSPMGEHTDDRTIQIPSIKVNKKNLWMMNSSKSFIGIFQAELKSQRDPHFVTKVVEQELKQIAVQMFQAWHKLIGFVSQEASTALEVLKDKHKQRLSQNSQLYVIGDEKLSPSKTDPYQESRSPFSRKRKLSGQMSRKVDTEGRDLFGAPNSPSKIRNCLDKIQKRRFTAQNYRELKGSFPIELIEEKSSVVYDPILFEEKFYNGGVSGVETIQDADDKQSREVEKLARNFTAKGSLQLADNTQMKSPCPLSRSSSVIDGSEKKQLEQLHLFVFVHGFQASSLDMRNFKNYVSLVLPDAVCLCATANEEFTDGSIAQMGKNLAIEVRKHIQDWCYSRDGKILLLNKITFVGHSLGGIIIRSALTHLQSFKKYMHAYISLGSPHLGYMYNTNSLINAGMWVLKRLKKSQCLQQLSMTDHPDKRKTFLYKLSKDEGLQHFKHVFFISSYQDAYAPHDSARVQVCSRAAHTDQSRGNLYTQMADGILSSLRCEQLVRMDVNFRIGMNLDSFIGRTAHMLLLESEQFVESFVNKYLDVFEE